MRCSRLLALHPERLSDPCLTLWLGERRAPDGSPSQVTVLQGPAAWRVAAELGFGRIAALYYRPPSLYQIH